jgi:hypothetical protein
MDNRAKAAHPRPIPPITRDGRPQKYFISHLNAPPGIWVEALVLRDPSPHLAQEKIWVR